MISFRVNNLEEIPETKSQEGFGKMEELSVIKETESFVKKSNEARIPFKKFLANKRLNPRLVTSTIMHDQTEGPPKKVNFKKVMGKKPAVS